jgi:EAL domain-containing protein (putative c-di-GMP-specific phosphodiesterase class I)
MHMTITVEGIERTEQADLLQQMGCEEGQGFLFAPPLTFEEWASLIGHPSNR